MLRFALLLVSISVWLPTISFGQEYPLGPEFKRQPGVPAGKVTKHSWTSKIFPGTVRDYWVYVPAQYDAASPAAVVVFQDGHRYVSDEPDGGWFTLRQSSTT